MFRLGCYIGVINQEQEQLDSVGQYGFHQNLQLESSGTQTVAWLRDALSELGKAWESFVITHCKFYPSRPPPPTSSLRAARVDGRAAMFATINALKLTISHF